MFNKVYTSIKGSYDAAVESYESAKTISGTVFNNFSAFCSGAVRPVLEGTAKTAAIMVAKTAIHTARAAYDISIDVAKIGYNVVKTTYILATTKQWDWAAGKWHSAKGDAMEVAKAENADNVTSEEATYFSTVKDFVSKTWHTKDDSNLGQVSKELDNTIFAKLVVDGLCLAQAIIWDAVIVTTAEGAMDTTYKASTKGYEAAEENQNIKDESVKDSDIVSKDEFSELMNSVEMIDGLEGHIMEMTGMDSAMDIDFIA